MKSRLILFDVDQTLIFTDGAGRKAFEVALEILFGLKDGLKNVSISGKTDTSILYDALERKSLRNHLTPELETEFWKLYLSKLMITIKSAERATILDGIPELLKSLRQSPDVFLGLLTGNIKEGAKIKLEHFDLWNYFPVGAFGDEHPDRNEIAKIALERSSRHFNRIFDDIFVIGDSLNDIACAKAIHAKSVIAATGSHSIEELFVERPYSLFKTWKDTAAVLNALQGKPFFEPNGGA